MRLNAIITAILYTILLALPAAATADAGYAEIIKSSTIADLLSADESGSTADVAVSNDRMIGDGFSFIGDAPELSGAIEQPLILQ
ncbi:MAG: hypothetical protein IID59_10405 [Proteobacteria bacterium]|nr:hypothetical protein [Pseudomonadota bacterium]